MSSLLFPKCDGKRVHQRSDMVILRDPDPIGKYGYPGNPEQSISDRSALVQSADMRIGLSMFHHHRAES